MRPMMFGTGIWSRSSTPGSWLISRLIPSLDQSLTSIRSLSLLRCCLSSFPGVRPICRCVVVELDIAPNQRGRITVTCLRGSKRRRTRSRGWRMRCFGQSGRVRSARCWGRCGGGGLDWRMDWRTRDLQLSTQNACKTQKPPLSGGFAMRLNGVEPSRPVRDTRPSTLRVYQFRHSRSRAADSRCLVMVGLAGGGGEGGCGGAPWLRVSESAGTLRTSVRTSALVCRRGGAPGGPGPDQEAEGDF